MKNKNYPIISYEQNMCRNYPISANSKTDGNRKKNTTLKNICCVYKKVPKKLLGYGNQDQPAQEFHTSAENSGKCKCGSKWKRIEVKDRIDQTGEPAFVVQVRRGGQEIANLVEVQDHVRKLGKSRILCTCPTFNKSLQHSIKHVCPSGSCRKALNNKSISIDCKCESRKLRFCTDNTCVLKDMKPLARFNKMRDPLFSMNVNTDKNTIMNYSDIQKRIANYRHKICKTGRCRDSFNRGEMDFTCECPYVSNNCTDKTCNNCICLKNKDTR